MGDVLTVGDVSRKSIEALLDAYDLSLVVLPDGARIVASFWGDSEAGIAGNRVYARSDTPLHSLLHETGHIVCMSDDRRRELDRDAGGNDIEEAAVCYLQIVLSDRIDGLDRARLMADMDTWGYSFRLGSAARWFVSDADDARQWLIDHNLLNAQDEPTFRLRS